MSKDTIFNPNLKCNCSVLNSTYTPCPDKSNVDCCLRLCNILTTKDISPCNELGTLDVTNYIIIPSCCKKDIDNNKQELSIPFHSKNLKDVNFSKIGDRYIVSYTSNWSQGLDYKSAKIVYQFKCGILNVQADIIIPFKVAENSCTTSTGIFNPCTGDCLETVGGVFGEHPDFDTTDHNDIPNHTTISTFTPGENNTCNDPIFYHIEEYTPSELSNVQINSNGDVSYDENCNLLNYPANIYIKYGATKCGITVYGEIRRYLDPCKGYDDSKCDPCDGIPLIAENSKIEVICGSTNNEILPITSGASEYFIVDSSIFTNVTISNIGKIVFDFNTLDISEFNFKSSYYITYRAKKGKKYCDATIEVTLCDLCIGVPLQLGQKCDPCTGNIISVEDKEFKAICNSTQTFDVSQLGFTEYNVLKNGGLVLENLSNTGVLTITTDDQSIGKTFIILMEAKIGSVICTYNVKISIPDLSIGLTCPDDCIANPCTGNCDPIPPVLIVTEEII